MEEKNQGGKFKPVETVQIDSVLFSAVVPVYNVEAYLEKCVDSLLKQKDMEGKMEILLIDDGSQDRSGRICDRLSAEYAKVKTYHKKNRGLSSARKDRKSTTSELQSQR